MRDDVLSGEWGGNGGEPHPDEGTVHAWLDNALPVYEAAMLDRHVANCPACAAMVAEARTLTATASRIVRALDGDVHPLTSATGSVGGSTGAGSTAPRGPMLVRDAGPSGPSGPSAPFAPSGPRATSPAPTSRRPLMRWRVTPARAAAATLLLVAGGSMAVLNERGRESGASAATDALVMDLALDSTTMPAAAPPAALSRGVEVSSGSGASTAEAEQAFAPELAARRRLQAPPSPTATTGASSSGDGAAMRASVRDAAAPAVAAVQAPQANAVLGQGQGGVGSTSASADRSAAARKAAPSVAGDMSMQSRAASAPPPVATAPPSAASSARPSAATAALTVTRPTVVAFLVVPPGTVETRPDMAVTADDWNIAMATLGDSLRAQGIELALITASRLRLTSGGTTVVLQLGVLDSAGYVYVRPGTPPCLEHGARALDVVLARARVRLGPVAGPGATSRDGCAR